MKILKVLKKGRELGRVQLLSPSILVGRSPFCDLVLRMKGVNPVQYIVEWVGIGEFDSQAGKWAVFKNYTAGAVDEKIKTESFGEGQILSDKLLVVDDFEFQIYEDHLSESFIEKGKIKDQFLKENSRFGIRKNVLEVVSVFNDSESISQIYHFDTQAYPQISLPDLSQISIMSTDTPQGSVAKINVAALTGAKIFTRGQPLQGPAATKGEVTLQSNDLIQVSWKLKDYYFRFVPPVQVDPLKFQLSKHKFGLISLLIALFFFGLFTLVKLPEFKPEVPLKPPPRIAKIEVKEVAPPAPKEVPPPPPKEEPAPEPPQEKVMPKKEQPVVEHKAKPALPAAKSPPKEVLSAKPQFVEPTKTAPKVALDSPAPKAKAPSVGLLGMLKNKKASTISADQVINQGLVTKTVSGEKTNFVIQQSPSGIVTSKKLVHANGTLTGAASSRGFKDTGNGSMPTAVRSGSVDGVGDLGSLSGVKGGSDSSGFSGGESVEGGLDRESVRRVINSFKKEIRTCYEKALTSKSHLNGRILYRWGITPAGSVSYVNMLKSEVGSINLEECVADVIKSMKFPQAPNKKPTVVVYPYVFQTKN